MQITLTGDVAPHEKSFRARVDGLGVHAYGATADEATERALRASRIKLDIWYMSGVLLDRLSELSVQVELDTPADMIPPPRECTHMELTSA